MSHEPIVTDGTEPAPARIKFKPKYISKSRVRQFILDYAASTRGKKFTRVSDDVFFSVEACLKRFCQDLVNRHPSKGKTISMG